MLNPTMRDKNGGKHRGGEGKIHETMTLSTRSLRVKKQKNSHELSWRVEAVTKT